MAGWTGQGKDGISWDGNIRANEAIYSNELTTKGQVDILTTDHPHQDVNTSASPEFARLSVGTTGSLELAQIGDGTTATNQFLAFQTNNNKEVGINYYLSNGTTVRGFVKWDAAEDLLLKGDQVVFSVNSGVALTLKESSRDVIVGTNLEVGRRFELRAGESDFPSVDANLVRIFRTTAIGGSYPFNEAGHLVLQSRDVGLLRDIIFATGNPSVVRMIVDGSGNIDFQAGNLTTTGDINTGNLLFTQSGKGLPYGEIYVNDNTTVTSVSNAGFTQFLHFNTNGHNNLTTPDHTNDHITIVKAGVYMVECCVNIKNDSGAAHDIEVVIAKANGTSIFQNLRRHRTLGTGTDIGAIPLCGHLSLAVDDTIEVWITSDSAGARDVIAEDVTLMVTMVGG